MRIIKITSNKYGGHENQGWDDVFSLPKDYAVIPDNMETENFPFGEIETKVIDGVLTVTKWIPGTIPETPEAEKPITQAERLAALEAAVLEMALGGAE